MSMSEVLVDGVDGEVDVWDSCSMAAHLASPQTRMMSGRMAAACAFAVEGVDRAALGRA